MFPVSADIVPLAVDEMLQERNNLSEFLKLQLDRATRRMKRTADAKRSFREFQIGEQVLLKLQPYVQQSVVRRPYPKLSFKYFGPYTVLAKYGSVAYKLELPSTSEVHPVFHVSQLKSYVPDHTPVFTELPTPLQLDIAELEPKEILDRRLVKKGNKSYLQVLIKWSTMKEDMATWEDYEVVRQRFPDAAAWGQAASQGEASVTLSMTREELPPGKAPTGVTSSEVDDGKV
jgi:ribosomal protein L21E